MDRSRVRARGPKDDSEPSTLLKVRLGRADIHGIERRPAAQERLLRLAWLCALPDPEAMSLDELKNGLESRGYDVDRGHKSTTGGARSAASADT